MASVPVIESEVEFAIEGAGKSCKTWYTIFGTFPSPAGIRPLICLHGGPGVPHNVLRPIGNLWSTHDIPVIMYDMLGCGRSTRLPEKMGATEFWTLELFLKQLHHLIAHLGIAEYDILGQSFGGLLGTELAVTHPKGLRRLIVANTPASKALQAEALRELRAQLPPDVQATMKAHEAAGTLSSVEYQDAVGVFMGKYMCRVTPLPKDLIDSLQSLREDPTVIHTMNGPNLFKQTGSMKDWSITDRINLIKVPTLLINGKYDAAQDSVLEPFFKGIEKVKWVKFAQSSHFPQIEEPEEYLEVAGGFLSMK